MELMKVSGQENDEMRLGYIQNACDLVQERVIEIVIMMLDKSAHECDESVKSEIIVPLF